MERLAAAPALLCEELQSDLGPGSRALAAVVIFKYFMNIQPQLAATSQPMVDQFKLSNFNLWRCMQRKGVTSSHFVSYIPSL